jgi:CRP/FNR family transcriptional regulator, cyclic AMP receptor protein
LDRLLIFKNMNEQHLNLLQRLFERYSFRSGAVVVQQGASADYFYLVISGKAQVSFKPYDGSPITVSHVGKDGLFGWSAVLGSRTYTSSVTAIEDLETYRINGARLRNLCKDYPEAGKDILERLASIVSSRWTNAHEQVKSFLFEGLNN